MLTDSQESGSPPIPSFFLLLIIYLRSKVGKRVLLSIPRAAVSMRFSMGESTMDAGDVTIPSWDFPEPILPLLVLCPFQWMKVAC